MELSINNINCQTRVLNNEPKTKQRRTVTFEMAPGNFINKDAAAQRKALADSLIPVFERGKDFAAGIEEAVKRVFPLLNFKLGNISDLQYASIKKEQPLLFSRTSFKKAKPQTFMYLNFPEIIDLVKSKSSRRIEGLSEKIAGETTFFNEPHFISNVIDMCSKEVKKRKSLNIDEIAAIVDKCLSEHNITIDNVVLDKKDADKISEIARSAKTPITDVRFSEDSVKTKLCVIMDSSDKDIRHAISHEFTHTLNANSLWFNEFQKNLFTIPDAPLAQFDFAPSFLDFYNKDPYFLNMSAKKRGEEYEKILVKTLENASSKRDKQLLFDQMLAFTSDEAFAYSQTPGLFSEYKQTSANIGTGGPVQIPVGWFYVDFYDFLLSVKNNASLLKKLTE